MKMTALVLLGIVLGLGLIILPTLGSPSFFFGSATQTGAAEGKNDTGYNVVDGGNSTVMPAAAGEGNSVYRSLNQGPMGTLGAPALVLAAGLVVAAVAYLLIRRSAL